MTIFHPPLLPLCSFLKYKEIIVVSKKIFYIKFNENKNKSYKSIKKLRNFRKKYNFIKTNNKNDNN